MEFGIILETIKRSRKILSKMPYLSTFVIKIIDGSLFILLSGTLIFLIIEQKSTNNIEELSILYLSKCFELCNWISNGTINIILFTFISLLVGFLITPIERIVIVIVSAIMGTLIINPLVFIINYFKEENQSIELFAPKNINNKTFVENVYFLHLEPSLKKYWEWRYMIYHIFWSIFFNIFTFGIIFLCILGSNLRFIDIFIFLMISGIFLVYALWQSYGMAKADEISKNILSKENKNKENKENKL